MDYYDGSTKRTIMMGPPSKFLERKRVKLFSAYGRTTVCRIKDCNARKLQVPLENNARGESNEIPFDTKKNTPVKSNEMGESVKS